MRAQSEVQTKALEGDFVTYLYCVKIPRIIDIECEICQIGNIHPRKRIYRIILTIQIRRFLSSAMTLIEEIESFFGTKDLYEVIGADKKATSDQIKKAYRKASLKIHPDRVPESEKKKATQRFQILAQVHYVLSDSDRRNLYDQHGIIANEDSLDSEADWESYWRVLFPKVTEKDISTFIDNYIGSKEEETDLINLYNRFEGDMDKIYESHIAYDEERTTTMLNKLIETGKIEKFSKFTDEPEDKKARRVKRSMREAKRAAKAKKEREQNGEGEDDMSKLTAMIQGKRNFNSMIASLEAKYAPKSSKTNKRSKKS